MDTAVIRTPPAGQGNITPVNIVDARRLRVHRLLTRQIGSDKYLVGRAGVRGAVTTTRLGVTAIGLLRDGKPPREVEALLARSTDTTVDLSTLLSALMRAGFIARADSMRFETPRANVWTIVKAYARPRLKLVEVLTHFLSTSVPPELGLVLLRALRRRSLSVSASFCTTELARRMSAHESPVDPAVCQNHQKELADQDALTRLVIQAQPRRLDRWLRNHVTLIGRDHLLDPVSAGRGTIIAAYHYGAFPLIPVSLAANGFSIAMPHFGVHFGAIPHERVFDAHAKACGWAPVVVHRDGSLAMIAQLVRTLRAGGMAVISVDYCNPRPPSDHRQTKDAAGRQRQIEVTVAGRKIMVENLVGWLAATTNSRVLPAVGHRNSGRSYAVELRPALEFVNSSHLPLREYASTVTRRIVDALEPDVAAHPAKWAFLTTFTPGGDA